MSQRWMERTKKMEFTDGVCFLKKVLISRRMVVTCHVKDQPTSWDCRNYFTVILGPDILHDQWVKTTDKD